MIMRISAEFDSPELAELAIKRVKESNGNGVHSANIIYNKNSDKAEKLRNGTIYTVIPTAVTSHSYFTAVIESPASEDVIPEPIRSRRTRAYIICDRECSANVSAVLNSMGGLSIKSSENKSAAG